LPTRALGADGAQGDFFGWDADGFHFLRGLDERTEGVHYKIALPFHFSNFLMDIRLNWLKFSSEAGPLRVETGSTAC
jgi:hypothetical protein